VLDEELAQGQAAAAAVDDTYTYALDNDSYGLNNGSNSTEDAEESALAQIELANMR
jgi:hypothetical protein